MHGTIAAVPASRLDRDNPWPGLESFEEDAQDYFHGREGEEDELLHRVADAPLTVLFGKSGLGKTSLLKAGLFPRLREQHFLPVHVRLDLRPEAPGLVEQILDGLRAEIERACVDAPPFAAGETLWEYLHRADLELWSAQNYPLTPVLVLDQFEEVFTLGERLPEAVEHFRIDLGDLAENRIPAALAGRLAADASAAQRLDLRRMAYKLVVALREDFLPHLEGWRAAVPSLGRVRVRLLPMRPEQALSAVYDTAPHLMDEPLARRIVAFVAAAQTAATQGDGAAQEASGTGEIEPALLSLFCRGLNERRKRRNKDRFDEQLLEGAQQSIIADYYHSCVESLPDSVSRFIETNLITEKGFRNSFAKDDAVPGLLTQKQLERLINRRLLRLEERYGTVRIELTHDLLTRAVMAHRDRRRVKEERRELEEQARRQRRRVFALALIALICLAFAGVAAWQWGEAVAAKKAAEKATKGAEAAAQTAQTAEGKAEEARTQAEADRRQAVDAQRSSLSAKLASDALAERNREQLDLSFLLGAAAWSAKPTAEARSVLLSNLLEQQALRGILPARSTVSAAVFSPDGKTLAAANGDNTIVLWDVASHTSFGRPLVGHKDRITSVAFSPDGKTLASGSWDETIILWDLGRRAPLCPPLAGQDRIGSVAFSPDGKTLAAGENDAIILWDVGHRVPLGQPFDGHKLYVTSVAFSPDGKTLASGNIENAVVLWDIASRQPRGEPLRGHKERVRSLAFGLKGKYLASGSEDGTIILWDVASHTALGTLDHKDPVTSVAFSPGGDTIASGSVNGSVILWDVEFQSSLGKPLVGHRGPISSVAFSPDGKTLAAGSEGKAVVLWDTGLKALGKQLFGPQVVGCSVAFSPDGKTFAIATYKAVVLWNIARRKLLGVPLGVPLNGEVLSSVAYSADGKTLAAASDKNIVLVDVIHRRPLGRPMTGPQDSISSLAFSPDGKTLASGGEDGTVVLWGIAGRDPGKPLAKYKGTVWSLAFSPDGRTLASGSEDGAIGLWDVARRTPLTPLTGRGDGGPVFSLAFSSDGKTLAEGRAGGAIHLWNIARHASFGKPLAGDTWVPWVSSIAFSPDGKTLASGDSYGTVILWDMVRRVPLGELIGHLSRVQSVHFSPDGKTLASGDNDGSVNLWDVDPDSWSRQACLIASRNLTCDEWHRYLPDEPYRKLCPEFPGPERCAEP